MADSAEHKYISQSLDRALRSYSETRLMGLSEAERRKFDYGCMILRDATRPLVSQVLWGHEEGIEKDMRTLIFEEGSSLKLYFVRDKIKNRAKIDDIMQNYRQNPQISSMLRGLKIVPVPEDFNADSLRDQAWMDKYILETVSSDLLFAVVFGKLTTHDVRTFSLHGGPLGLKIAALQVIDSIGFQHGPTFEQDVGSKGSPLREVIAMLTGVGFVVSPGNSIQRLPTIKGRFMLDLARLLTFERNTLTDWSDETKLILAHLKLNAMDGWQVSDEMGPKAGVVSEILRTVEYARRQFGVDLMEGVSQLERKFYSPFPADRFLSGDFMGATAALWSNPDDIAFFG